MQTIDVNAQEDLAFDSMDAALENAVWHQGLVRLTALNTTYFCYDVPQLRSCLKEVALTEVARKHRHCGIDIDFVVTNILEEYADELKQHALGD
jgi:hypothetical protein